MRNLHLRSRYQLIKHFVKSANEILKATNEDDVTKQISNLSTKSVEIYCKVNKIDSARVTLSSPKLSMLIVGDYPAMEGLNK